MLFDCKSTFLLVKLTIGSFFPIPMCVVHIFFFVKLIINYLFLSPTHIHMRHIFNLR